MNKKIIMFALLCTAESMYAYHECGGSNFDLALTSGFVWKRDNQFKCVYGSGVIDALTVDGCYYPCMYGGIGIKSSYWEKKGETTALKQHTRLHEVPLIGYLRGRIGARFQGYLSLGGGVIFVREKSYLGCVSAHSAIGEAEIGINYHVHHTVYLTIAANALFPSKIYNGQKVNFGGYGLRAGIGFSF